MLFQLQRLRIHSVQMKDSFYDSVPDKDFWVNKAEGEAVMTNATKYRIRVKTHIQRSGQQLVI